MAVATMRFSGRAFSDREVTLIGKVVRDCSGLSRMELARTVCELLRWRRPNGKLKARECREFLERLDAEGALVLPDKRRGRGVGSVTRVPRTAAGEPGRPLVGSVRDIEPLEVELVQEPAQRLLFRELVGRYHYLGHRVPFGGHLRNLVFASKPVRAVVGCLQFSSPAWRMAVRDRWVGWDDGTRARNLQRVVNNSRFLLLPWVGVKNLASAVLARRPGAVGGGLAAPVPPRAVAGGDAGGCAAPPRGLLPRRQLGRVGRHERSRAHGPARPPCRRGDQDGPGLSCGPGCEAAAAGGLSDASRPHRDAPSAPAPYAAADAVYADAKAYLSSREAQQMSESDLERELNRRGQELLRKLLQGHLDQRSPGEAAGPVAGADGVERTERRVHERHLETTFGTVDVERVGYARAGHESLHPLDASLNLPPERYSLEVRRRVAEAAASRSREAHQQSRQSLLRSVDSDAESRPRWPQPGLSDWRSALHSTGYPPRVLRSSPCGQ